MQQWYMALCMGSLLFNLLCITVCVVNLSYVDPLTELNALKFFLANADTIGDPVVLMAESFIFFIAAIFVWCLGTYGLASGMLMLLASIVFVLSAANVWKNRAKFTAANVDWTQDTSLWRREYTTGGVMANLRPWLPKRKRMTPKMPKMECSRRHAKAAYSGAWLENSWS